MEKYLYFRREAGGERHRKIFQNHSRIFALGTTHGYFDVSEEEGILIRLMKQPDVLFVALGAPKQENGYINIGRLQVKVAMGRRKYRYLGRTAKMAPKIYQTLIRMVLHC